MTSSAIGSRTQEHIELTETYAAHNYHPLPVVLASGEGAWVTDVDGKRYLDCLAGYSALNFGHGHPRLLARMHEQIDKLTLTSRAFFNDQLGPFAKALAELTGKDLILPMNSGAEAVETAIKVSRRWGYDVKGVAEAQASIVVMEGNFHGRTTTIVSFSNDSDATAGYAPYTPGFRMVPYGDIAAVRAAIDETTVAVLLEPIQGEGGVIMPPEGFLREVRALCDETDVLMVADEIQSGLGRSGTTFACDHEGVVPDIYILGKALGGGLYPVSAIAADHRVLDVITPGSHGSTFGGNPLAAPSAARSWRCCRPASSRPARSRSAPASTPASRRSSATASTPYASVASGAASTSPTAWPPAARSPRRCSPRASSPRRPTARPSASLPRSSPPRRTSTPSSRPSAS